MKLRTALATTATTLLLTAATLSPASASRPVTPTGALTARQIFAAIHAAFPNARLTGVSEVGTHKIYGQPSLYTSRVSFADGNRTAFIEVFRTGPQADLRADTYQSTGIPFHRLVVVGSTLFRFHRGSEAEFLGFIVDHNL